MPEAEVAYDLLRRKIKETLREVPWVSETFVLHSKDDYLKKIRESGYFAYAREVLFSNAETCTRERLKKLMLSMSTTQKVLAVRPDLIEDDIRTFEQIIDHVYTEESFKIMFCYRMRLGIKKINKMEVKNNGWLSLF